MLPSARRRLRIFSPPRGGRSTIRAAWSGESFGKSLMPSPQTLARFIARVEENAHAEAILEFYADNASMQENQSAPRVGRDALAARERAVLAKARSVRSTCVRPVFVNGDRVVEETFFYDPAQLVAQKP